MIYLNYFILLITGILLSSNISAEEIYDFGGMYTYHYRDGRYADWGHYSLLAAHMAIKEINQSGMIGDNKVRMKKENIIDYHCWPKNAGLMAETLMKKSNILVITGADCSGPAVKISEKAKIHRIPVISNGANASNLSSIKDHPWFIRVVTPSELYERYLIDVAKQLKVVDIAYFFTTDAWGQGASKVIHEATKKNKINIKKEYSYPRDTDQLTIDKFIKEVIDLKIQNILITAPTPDTVKLFTSLHKNKLNKPGYLIFAAEMISADENRQAIDASLGYFSPMAFLNPSDKLNEFKIKLEQQLDKEIDSNSKAFFYAALSYDHIMAIGHSIKKIKDNNQVVNRGNLMQHLRTIDFNGLTGRVAIKDGTNDRDNMAIQIMNSHGFDQTHNSVKFVPVGHIDPQTNALLLQREKIILPGNIKPRIGIQ